MRCIEINHGEPHFHKYMHRGQIVTLFVLKRPTLAEMKKNRYFHTVRMETATQVKTVTLDGWDRVEEAAKQMLCQ